MGVVRVVDGCAGVDFVCRGGDSAVSWSFSSRLTPAPCWVLGFLELSGVVLLASAAGAVAL